MATSRRELRFQHFDEVIADAEHLNRVGYDRVGKWDLGQVIGHVSEWIRYPMDGYPKITFPFSILMWALRNTVGKPQKKKLLAQGKFPPGGPTVKESVPPAGKDEQVAISQLNELIDRVNRYEGKLFPSPLFGELTRDDWLKLSLIHAAHHLSFLVPKTN